MKTIKFAIVIACALFVAAFLSCSPVAYPVGTSNPLDQPGYI